MSAPGNQYQPRRTPPCASSPCLLKMPNNSVPECSSVRDAIDEAVQRDEHPFDPRFRASHVEAQQARRHRAVSFRIRAGNGRRWRGMRVAWCGRNLRTVHRAPAAVAIIWGQFENGRPGAWRTDRRDLAGNRHRTCAPRLSGARSQSSNLEAGKRDLRPGPTAAPCLCAEGCTAPFSQRLTTDLSIASSDASPAALIDSIFRAKAKIGRQTASS